MGHVGRALEKLQSVNRVLQRLTVKERTSKTFLMRRPNLDQVETSLLDGKRKSLTK